jgi:hypothetical protein
MLMLCRYLTIPARFDEHSWRERIFSIEHTEKLVALSKKVDRGKLMRKNLELMNQIIQSKTHKNQNTFKSRLNGQPQLTIIQVAKS